MSKSAIEWTTETWNPVVGCTQITPGCAHCYAKTLHARRHKAFLAGKNVAPQYAHPFEKVQLMPDRLRAPLSRRAPTTYFVNSVSDLFHEDVPDKFLDEVFAVIAKAQRHTFQILTKRPERMRDYMLARRLGFPLPNVWLGVSVENQRWTSRIPILLETPAKVRFLSCEPLLGPIDICEYLREEFDVTDDGADAPDGAVVDGMVRSVDQWIRVERLHWVIVGGESGNGARAMNLAWARSLRDQCERYDVAFFLKQLGGATDKRGHDDAILDGRRHAEMPAFLA